MMYGCGLPFLVYFDNLFLLGDCVLRFCFMGNCVVYLPFLVYFDNLFLGVVLCCVYVLWVISCCVYLFWYSFI